MKRILWFIGMSFLVAITEAFGFNPYQQNLDISKITCDDFIGSLYPSSDEKTHNGFYGPSWEGEAIFTWLDGYLSPKNIYSKVLLTSTKGQLAKDCSQARSSLIIDLYPLSHQEALAVAEENFSQELALENKLYNMDLHDVTCAMHLMYTSKDNIGSGYFGESNLSLAAIWVIAHDRKEKVFNLAKLKNLGEGVSSICQQSQSAFYLFVPIVRKIYNLSPKDKAFTTEKQ